MNPSTENSGSSTIQDQLAVILCASILYTISMTISLAMPALIGVVADHWEFPGSQLGVWAAMYSLGSGCVSLSAYLWIRRVNLRLCSLAGLLLMSGAFGLQFIAADFGQLAFLMLLTGLGSGLLASPTITVLGDASDPQRSFGIMIFISVLLPALVTVCIPMAIDRAGYPGMLLLIVTLIVITIPLVPFLPKLGLAAREQPAPSEVAEWSGPKQKDSLKLSLALAGMVLYVLGFIAAWNFLERVGGLSGLAQAPMLRAIALGGLIGGLGGFVATWLGRFLALRASFLLTIAATMASLFMLGILNVTLVVYSVAVALYALWINVNFSNIMSFIAKIDLKGRFVAMIPGLQALGAFVGSTAAGFGFEESGGSGVLWVSGIGFMACSVAMLASFRLASRKELSLSPLSQEIHP